MEDETIGLPPEGPALSATVDLPANPPPPPADDESAQKGVQKRMDELTAARRAAERIAAAAERRAEALEASLQQALALSGKDKEPPPPAKPKKADFQDPDAYDEALVEWSASEATRRIQAKESKAKEELEKTEAAKALNEQMKEWATKVKKASVKYLDFSEVVENEDLVINAAMRSAIFGEDNGTDVAYHLGKNPAEAERISKLSPERAVAAIAKLAAKLEESPPVTKTPPPVKPVGSKTPASGKGVDTLSMDEYAAARLKQIRGKT